MSKDDKLWKIVEITLEVGPEVVQGVVDLLRSEKMTGDDVRVMKEASKSPREILAEHGITL